MKVHLFQRSDSPIWYAACWLPGRSGGQGQWKRFSCRTTKKRLAHEFALTRVAELRAKLGHVDSDVTLRTLVAKHLARCTVDELRSISAERTHCQHILDYFGPERKVRTLTVDDIELLRQYLLTRKDGRGPLSRSTVNRVTASLGRLLKSGRLPTDILPVKYREPTARQGFVSEEQFRRIHAEITDPDVADVALALYHSGWRKMEMLDLLWDEVSLGDRELRLRPERSKSREGRSLPLFGELEQLFQSRASARRGIHVFSTANGEPPSKDQFSRQWKKAAKRAGLGHILAHDLRRSCIRRLVLAGISLPVAQLWSGHRTLSTFLRYAITSPSDLRDAANRLESSD